MRSLAHFPRSVLARRILRKRPTLASGVHHRSGPRNWREGGTQIGGVPGADSTFGTRTRFRERIFLMFRQRILPDGISQKCPVRTLSRGLITCLYVHAQAVRRRRVTLSIHPSAAMQNWIINHCGAPNRSNPSGKEGRKEGASPLLTLVSLPLHLTRVAVHTVASWSFSV